jgi:NADPH-dependent ferric siderophore reductase
MNDDDLRARMAAIRREPPPLQRITLVERVERSPRLLRLTFAGEGLHAMAAEPAASVRVLVPTPGTDELVVPDWNGNEFLLDDGTRPAIRTFTPLASAMGEDHLDIDIVRHPGGAVSDWAERAVPGTEAAISGPGAAYEFPTDADTLLVFGDETAIPAITQLIEHAPESLSLRVVVEVVTDQARVELPASVGAAVTWTVTRSGATPGAELVEHVRSLTELPDGTDVFAAGEASAMQAIRKHIFNELGIGRQRATIRGYWKPAR